MRKLITIILVLVLAASVASGQTTYQLNYDSIRVGKTAGNGATSLYGKTYLKNATEGTPSDSVLTVRNGRVYKIAGSAISSVGFLTYVFSRDASDISGYEQMPALTSYTAGAADTATVAATTTPAIIQEFATNTGFPNTTLIPSGVFNVSYQVQKNSGSQSFYTYAVIYKRNLAGAETAIATTNNSSSVSANTVQSVSVSAVSPTDISVLTTDRIVVKVFAVMVSGTADISIYYDDATDSRLAFPSALVDATNFVPYNGGIKDLVSAFSITGDSIKRVGGTDAQFLKGDGSVTTLSATSPIFYNSGVISSQAASLTESGFVNTTSQSFGGLKTFDQFQARSETGGTLGIGLKVEYDYSTIGQPKTLMNFYGQSGVNGAVELNSVNGTGGNKITPFSWKANGATRLLDTLTLQSAENEYKATISIGRDTTPFSTRFDLGAMVFIDSAAIENPGEANPAFWFQNKTPLGYSGLGFRNTAGQYTADVGYSNLDSVLYFRSSSHTKALVVALHPETGKNHGFINFSNGRVHLGGFEGLTTRWRAALNIVKNTFTIGDTTSTTDNSLQVRGNGIADMGALELRNSTFRSTITGQATANRTIKFQNKSYTVADSADVAAISSTVSGIPELSSGTYTPTVTNGTNVSASGAAVFKYQRVGNQVSAFGVVDIVPNGAGAGDFRITLPISSALSSGELWGNGNTNGTTISNINVVADAANDEAKVNFIASSTSTVSVFFSFMYTINLP